MAACAVLILAAGVVANVAFLQGQPRERRVAQIPVGLATPPPDAQRPAEARRGSGPVTLSLASLIEASAPAATSQSPSQSAAAPSHPSASAAPTSPPTPTSRVSGIARSIDRLLAATPDAGRQFEIVREVQSALAARGYAPGPVDGEPGLLTRAAILAFEHDHGLPATAEPTAEILTALRGPARRSHNGAGWKSPSRAATALLKAAQQQLIATGHFSGTVTGQLDARTVAAIRSFETANDMMATGRISAPLMGRLQRAGAARARVASER